MAKGQMNKDKMKNKAKKMKEGSKAEEAMDRKRGY
jgi:hypothetical protein